MTGITNDSLIIITATQLKQINLIFNEHSKLLASDSILRKQIEDYKKIIYNSENVDSIRQYELDTCLGQLYENKSQIVRLNKELEKTKKESNIKTYIIGGLGVIALILGLIK